MTSLPESLAIADEDAANYIQTTGVKLACKPGCDWCCYLRVDILASEVDSIATYLQQTLSDNELHAVVSRLQSQQSVVSNMTVQQHQTTNVQCPLLVNQRCSVYPVRPIRCRAYTSLDVRSCEYSFNNPLDETERRPSDPRLDAFWDHVFGAQAVAADTLATHELGAALLRRLT